MLLTDVVHKSIEVHPKLYAVIDTRQFQRLRGLHQLGVASWVYPSATHTRFEHSIGVSYLALKMVRSIRDSQPELGITDKEELCVALAGLCHDLGHGPFSHIFDNEFLGRNNWTHEEGSIDMMRWMLDENHIDLGIDLTFVEDMILGKPSNKSRSFLYEIVNNSRNGFDMDKLDYLVRDSYMTGVGISMGTNIERIIQMARVLPDEDGVLTICFPKKSINTLFGIFHTRLQMHYAVYQHKTVKAIEYMIRDILIWANLFLPIRSLFDPYVTKCMKDVSSDVSVLYHLRDSVLDLVEHSIDPRMLPAQHILERLRRRDIYKFCGSIDNDNTQQLAEYLTQNGLNINDIILDVVCIHHGMGPYMNPINGMRFYDKHDLTTSFPANAYHAFTPTTMGTRSLYVYVKDNTIRETVRNLLLIYEYLE
jgi:HD superfamily phosphohydrolase